MRYAHPWKDLLFDQVIRDNDEDNETQVHAKDEEDLTGSSKAFEGETLFELQLRRGKTKTKVNDESGRKEREYVVEIQVEETIEKQIHCNFNSPKIVNVTELQDAEFLLNCFCELC